MAQTSKKELKEMRRLEEARRNNMEKKANMTKWIAIGTISAVFLGFFVFLVVSLKNNNPNLAETDGTQVQLSNSGEFRVAEGSTAPVEERPVTIVEFADIQCPACRQYHPIIKSLLEIYPETVALNFKHFPIMSIHPNAMPSAVAAEAAGRQDKFFEMVDLLFERQDAWARVPNPQSIFIEYARELELDVDQFTADLEDEELSNKVEAQRAEGINAGVNSTPTFFINGIKIQNPSDISGFQAIIDSILADTVGREQAPTEDVNSTPSAEENQTSTPQIDL